MRIHVTSIGETTARATTEEGREVIVQLAHTPFESLLSRVRVGDTLYITGGTEHRGIVTPALVVLLPDLLVDVTTLCACLRHYGFHALNSLIARYVSQDTTWQIQLGNMANDFFDWCVAQPSSGDGSFRAAAARSFHAQPLAYSAIDGIDAGFFYDAEQQFNNIHRTIHCTLPTLGIAPHDIVLEPQFLSPSLGLQGRMDALCTGTPTTIIELKSGKADEFHGGRAKEEHELQMMLYKEILGCTRRAPAETRNLLFYSRYPKLLAVHHTLHQLQMAIAVRNDIVALERDTREGRLPDIMDALTEADFNTRGEDGKLYCNYMRPVITRFLDRMQSLPPLERAYFHGFARFIAREQHAAKERFAQTWRTPLAAQEAEGEAVTRLTLHPIQDMDGSIVELRAETPRDLSAVNFRRGDSVMLWEAGNEAEGEAGMGGRAFQTFRCQIVGIGRHTMHLALAYKQRSERVFHLDRTYAITPSYMESTYLHACRGLTALITAPAERRAVLLGGEANGQCGRAYTLVVGPPGTGKTNVYLRSTVRRYLDEGQTLLVMAYTNQAVDEICGVLHDECPTLYARIGGENSCAAPYRLRMMQNITADCANRREALAAIAPLRVVCGTIASINAHPEVFRLKRFDTTIVDEASQVLEPQILPLLCRVGYFILIGDHKQLPAVVVQDRDACEVSDPLLRDIGLKNCADSYFERLYNLQLRRGTAASTIVTLDRQGRMHEELMSFVNRRFYGGILAAVPLPHQTGPLTYVTEGLSPLAQHIATRRRLFFDSAEMNQHHAVVDNNHRVVDDDHPVGDIDHRVVQSYTAGPASAKSNMREAEIVARVVEAVQEIYRRSGLTLSPVRSIGVIVPFRAQITAIRAAIADRQLAEQMTIDTVERYQGSQRDIIIYDTVVSSPDQLGMVSAPVTMDDGTVVDRKLNVALTRAREQLIVVGNRDALLHSELYAELMDWLTEG